MLEKRNSPVDGLGVFTTELITKGEVVVIADVLVIDDKAADIMLPYVFPWNGKLKESCICLNVITYTNRSVTPNIKIKSINRQKLTKTFTAIRDIRAGEELFLNYM